jgi:hypothetical protein
MSRPTNVEFDYRGKKYTAKSHFNRNRHTNELNISRDGLNITLVRYLDGGIYNFCNYFEEPVPAFTEVSDYHCAIDFIDQIINGLLADYSGLDVIHRIIDEHELRLEVLKNYDFNLDKSNDPTDGCHCRDVKIVDDEVFYKDIKLNLLPELNRECHFKAVFAQKWVIEL